MTSIRLVLLNELISVLIGVFLLRILRNTRGTVNQGATSQELLARGAKLVVSYKNSLWKRETLAVVAIAIAIILLLQLFIIAGYYKWRFAPTQIKLTVQDDESSLSYKERELAKSHFQRGLEMFANISAMYWVRENLPLDALVLLLRPADMYYAQRKMVSYLDERLLPVYGEGSPELAVKMLRDLGVTHLHVPDYGLPVSYNSVLDRIIEDPVLSRLLYTDGGTQILQLQPTGENRATSIEFQSVDFTPGNSDWTKYLQINLGGRKVLGFFVEFHWR